MLSMASAVKVKTGTFVGGGNIDQSINIEFEPDVLIINCSNLRIETAGWTGQKNIVFIKNMAIYQMRHNYSTQTSASMAASDKIGGQYPTYGVTDGYYVPYGVYSNGTFTISNGTRNNIINSFVNGETYDWIAIKL